MLFKRYNDPLGLLATYTPTDLVGFIVYTLKKREEDELWQIWLAKDINESFNDFKNKNISKQFRDKAPAMTKAKEEEVFAFTDQFIKPAK